MSKVDTIRSKYSSIRDTTFDNLSNGDTTPTKKYLEKMCQYWVSKGSTKLYIKTLILTINDFDKHLPYIENKDIYHPYYKEFSTLYNVVEQAKTSKFEKEFNREEHINVIYESEKYFALEPKTFQGSMKYGASTKWCTAGKSYESTFKNYQKHNHLIYVIRKDSKDTSRNKMAILIRTTKGIESLTDPFTHIYNPNDTTVNIDWFVRNGWDEDELVKILSHTRLYMYKKDKFNNLKDKVDTTINSISSINLIELMKNINILKNVDIVDNNEFDKHKKTIDDFVLKITEITKTY